MSDRPLVVLKFGGSVLRGEDDLPAIAAAIGAVVAVGQRVVAVVSAMGGSTDNLLCRAKRVCPDPEPSALSSLLATGEAASAALLALALNRAGITAAVLDPGRVGPVTTGPLLDADPVSFDRVTTLGILVDQPVAVMPGFVGRDRSGAFSVLGRGGSDLTALVVAHALGASRCLLVKDVDGIYESDPSARPGRRSHGAAADQAGPRPRRYKLLSWDSALRLGGKVTQPKALEYARSHDLSFEVGGLSVVSTSAADGAPRVRQQIGGTAGQAGRMGWLAGYCRLRVVNDRIPAGEPEWPTTIVGPGPTMLDNHSPRS
jgi:homoserine dehydrogenase